MEDAVNTQGTDGRSLTVGLPTALDILARDLASSIARRPVVPSLARTVLEQLKDYRKNPENRNAQRPRILKNIDRIIGR